MIGDWVNYRGTNIKITSLYDKGESNEIGWGLMESTWVNGINVEPIPLTAEILEKNGFTDGEYRHYVGCIWKLNVEGFRILNLTESCGKSCLWGEKIKPNYPNSVGNKFTIPNICYVHELQHAMRICGIEKEIII